MTRSQSKNTKRNNETNLLVRKPKRRKVVEEPNHNQELRETQIEYYKHLNLQHELQNHKRNLELKLAKVNKEIRRNHLDLQQFERDLEVLQHVLLAPVPSDDHHDTDDTYSSSSSSSSKNEQNEGKSEEVETEEDEWQE